MTLTYVYCLVRSARRPALRRMPPGMPGGDGVLALDAGESCWVIVSHVPDDQYGEPVLAERLGDLDWVGPRAMAHEAVVEQFLRARAVLPMPLMTLFTSDERAVTYLVRDRRRVDRLLDRIERQVEWGVRLMLDDRAADAAPPRASRTVRDMARDRRQESGLQYLARKRDQLDGHARRLQHARVQGDRLYRALAREATDAVRRHATDREMPGSRLLVDAAFLVPVARARAFRSVLRQHARELGASGLQVSLTGPWPPYHFAGRGPRGSRS